MSISLTFREGKPCVELAGHKGKVHTYALEVLTNTPETDPETGEVTWDKPPFQPNGHLGSSTNLATWSTFEEVMNYGMA